MHALVERTHLDAQDAWNLVAFQLNKTATPAQLEYKGSYHVGECVTAILRGKSGIVPAFLCENSNIVDFGRVDHTNGYVKRIWCET